MHSAGGEYFCRSRLVHLPLLHPLATPRNSISFTGVLLEPPATPEARCSVREEGAKRARIACLS